jgi:hypothetical protein
MAKVKSNANRIVKLSTIKAIHKWLSLVVFVQLLIWLGTGLFFNVMDHDKARGNQYRLAVKSVDINHQALMATKQVLSQSERAVKELSLVQRLGQAYYLLTHEKALYRHFNNEYSLVNAYTGKTQQIDSVMASSLAQQSYSGKAQVIKISKVSPPFDDFLKEQNTLWKIDFADQLNTSVYLDAGSGHLVGHSNDDKRFVDFFFMLHFMDYPIFTKERTGGFNNGQIIFFALLTLLLCLTGLIWTIEMLLKGRYKLR